MMSTRKIIIAGFGGQGVMAMGQLLTYAGLIENKHVSWLPSYGPEMRGGSANCSVVISDEPVGSPVIDQATDVIAMNGPSYDKFQARVIDGGNLFINTSLVDDKDHRDNINVYSVPVNGIAVDLGNNRVANMVMLGAYLQATKLVSVESVLAAFTKVYGDKKKKLIPLNQKALEAGQKVIEEGGESVSLTEVKAEDISRTPKANASRSESVSYVKNLKQYDLEEKAFADDESLVKEALMNVLEGIKFYEMSAKEFENTDAGKIFKSLANQKQEHKNYLDYLYKKIKGQDVKEVEKVVINEDKEAWESVKLADSSMAISVLSVAMSLENRSIDFYRKAISSTKNKEIVNLFDELIYWEQFQYDQLKGQYETHKDEWWSDQMFSKS